MAGTGNLCWGGNRENLPGQSRKKKMKHQKKIIFQKRFFHFGVFPKKCEFLILVNKFGHLEQKQCMSQQITTR